MSYFVTSTTIHFHFVFIHFFHTYSLLSFFSFQPFFIVTINHHYHSHLHHFCFHHFYFHHFYFRHFCFHYFYFHHFHVHHFCFHLYFPEDGQTVVGALEGFGENDEFMQYDFPASIDLLDVSTDYTY